MNKTNGRKLAAQATVALALGALQLSAFAQKLLRTLSRCTN
jgi:hypothetical protein